MPKPTLKSLLSKKNNTSQLLESWIKESKCAFRIEDENASFLSGNKDAEILQSHLLQTNGEIMGWVKGNDQAFLVAGFINLLLQKEDEKKKLGTEVLNLYQELNVIFNFSEKLAQIIEPDIIAKLTLDECMHSISSHAGLVLLWDENKKQMTVPALNGESLFNEEALLQNSDLLFKIGKSGQSEIINDLSFLKGIQLVSPEVRSLIYASMKVNHRIIGAIILAGKDNEQYSAANLKLLITLAQQSSAAIESAKLYERNIREAREREEAILRIHEVTKKFVPNEFIRSLGKEVITDVKLGDQVEKNVTVLFTDIRDFTSLSERMTPEENFRFVSSFNEKLGPIIRANNGFINQYLGDSIMAIFPDEPADALNAGIEMQRALGELNSQRVAKGLPIIKTGIGMHTGPLIMGITGDEFRLDAATISDTVNTAARIESLTKYYKTPLLLSGDTLRQIRDKKKFHLRILGKVQLKGKYHSLDIYECINGNTVNLQLKLKTLSLFHEGMNYYHNREFEKAIHIFQSVLAIHPDDLTSDYFLNKATKYLNQGVPENWTGAEEMMYK